MDQTYMGIAEEEEKETGVAHLLMHDNATSAFWCMKVDCKEAKPDIVAWMNQNLIDVGYAGMRVTLKSDGEPAMKALKGAPALKRGCETSITHLRRGNLPAMVLLKGRFKLGKVGRGR